ncbi:hypothetical protein EKN06_06535 [Croceicoccus ponticola]|uniref:Uncharacterized protein n=2 Tax=Croceicoccus ponticola TaxID=2217664 RepID=A0A437GY72_9SPHN|nr:hypothetical protein EKN06_06535 [Croceicoccus ponticola]
MRTLKNLTCAVAVAGLALSGVAHADTSRSVNMLPTSSVAKRGTAPTESESELANRRGGLVIAIAAAAAVAVGILIAVDGKDKSSN